MSEILKSHQPCIKCFSSDALTTYLNEDGRVSGFCFSCKERFSEIEIANNMPLNVKNKENRNITNKLTVNDIHKLPVNELKDRCIDKEFTEKFGVKVSYDETTREIDHHYYPYYKGDTLTGFKVRVVKDKKFYSIGDIKDADPFGWHLVKGRNFLIITEGEIDQLSAVQLLKKQGKNYNVVSIINSGTVKKHLEKINDFESIVLAFDQDKVGQDLAKKTAKLFDPGKVKIAKWNKDYKDANDLLKDNKAKEFLTALYSAKEYRPDGIVRLSQAWDTLFEDKNVESVLYPWEGLNNKLYGIRPKEIVTLTSGSGMGKSAVCRELEHSILSKIPEDENIGILALEENISRTTWGLMGIEANRPLHIKEERGGLTEKDFKEYFDKTVGTGRYIAYDHFGSTNTDNLINQIKYLIKAMDCKWIFLDHLSIVVSNMDEIGDERRTIDTIMTKLRQLAEETNASIFNVVHLRRMSGDKGHEQGGEISLNQLRGSHSIAQLSDAVIALERNQQAIDENEANLTLVRVLKNRYAGFVGPANHLFYDKNTGRLIEVFDKEEFLNERKDEEI